MPAPRHRLTHTPTYTSWVNMRRRCYNPTDKSFRDYGARGIVVCERWHSFDKFLADMGIKPAGMSLERRNNDGPYSPDNCCWATRGVQNNNTRVTVRLTHDGITQSLNDWARQFGVSANAIHHRLRRGWSVHDALTHPFRKPGTHVRNFHVDHETMSRSGRLGADARWGTLKP